MIKLSDGILQYIFNKSLKGDDLVVYLLICRYLTEGEEIPIDKVQVLSGLKIEEFNNVMTQLSENKILKYSLEKGKYYIQETLQNRLQSVISAQKKRNSQTQRFSDIKNNNLAAIRLQSVEENPSAAESLYISYSNNDNKSIDNKKVNKENKDYKEINKNDSAADSLQGEISKAKESINKNYRSLLLKLYNKSIQNQALQLQDYFAEALLKLYKRSLSRQWRFQQISVAKRILREHKDISLDEWKKMIDFFCKQQYWRDKLTSLKQVERNRAQYQGKKVQEIPTLKVHNKKVIR
jgi:hypothetical protein